MWFIDKKNSMWSRIYRENEIDDSRYWYIETALLWTAQCKPLMITI